MPRRQLVAVSLLVFSPLASLAADRDDALAIIEQGIAAQGGRPALERARVRIRHATGEVSLNGTGTFTETLETDLPDRVRQVLDIVTPAPRRRIITVLNRGRDWRQINDRVTDLDQQTADEFRDEAYVLWVASLLPLRERTFELHTMPPAVVEGQPAALVRVVAQNHDDTVLSFDKRTGRLLRIERTAPFLGVRSKRVYTYGDYRPFGGALLPTHEVQFIGGKKYTELTIKSYRFPDRLDDELFAKPRIP